MKTTDIPSFALLLLISLTLSWMMIRVGIMDLPVGRKAHARPTPKAGGVAAIGACVVGIFYFPILWNAAAIPMLAGALFLGGVGLLDDLRDRGAALKLSAQLLAGVFTVALFVRQTPEPDIAACLIAIGWLVFITNAFNFMDGLNGLAAGSGLIAAAFIATNAAPGGATQAAALTLAAGLAGFLPYNWPRARLFMGDTGSQFCGFLLGVLALGLAIEARGPRNPWPLEIWLPPLLLSGMIVDVSYTLVRRALAGARLTTAHREHLYQRAKLPACTVAAVHWGFVLLGGGAWLLLESGFGWAALALPGLGQLAWLGVVTTGGVRIRH